MVGGADKERLLRVVGNTPTSRAWSWRWSLPLQFVANGLADPNALLQTQREAVKHVLGAAGQDPDRAAARPVTIGRRRSVDLPAAEPTAHSDDPATQQQWDQFMRWLDEVLGDRRRRGRPRCAGSSPSTARSSRSGSSSGTCGTGSARPATDRTSARSSAASRASATRGRTACSTTSRTCRCARSGAGAGGRPRASTARRRATGGPCATSPARSPTPAPGPATRSGRSRSSGRCVEGLLMLAMADHGERGDVDRAAAALYDSATHRLDPWAVGARLAPARRAGRRRARARAVRLRRPAVPGRARARRPRPRARAVAGPGQDGGHRARPRRRAAPARPGRPRALGHAAGLRADPYLAAAGPRRTRGGAPGRGLGPGVRTPPARRLGRARLPGGVPRARRRLPAPYLRRTEGR